MDRYLTSGTPNFEWGSDEPAPGPDESPAPSPSCGAGASPITSPRKRGAPRPGRAPAPSCVDCRGLAAVADGFDTVFGAEALDVLVPDGTGDYAPIRLAVIIDGATGAVLDARLELRR